MNRIIISLSIIAIGLINTTCNQSQVKLAKIENDQLVSILNNSNLISKTQTDELSVRIYEYHNGSGSAGFSNGEVTHSLLIAVSEFDEVPNQNLFEIGPFYNPKFISWTKINEFEGEFKFQYGTYENEKILKFIVNINGLKIL